MGAGLEILGRVKPSPFYSLAAALSWPVLRWLYRLRAEGKENLPTEGGYVLAANHISNLDPWPLGLPLWPRRFLRFMAKSELYWWPLGQVITAGGESATSRRSTRRSSSRARETSWRCSRTARGSRKGS